MARFSVYHAGLVRKNKLCAVIPKGRPSLIDRLFTHFCAKRGVVNKHSSWICVQIYFRPFVSAILRTQVQSEEERKNLEEINTVFVLPVSTSRARPHFQTNADFQPHSLILGTYKPHSTCELISKKSI